MLISLVRVFSSERVKLLLGDQSKQAFIMCTTVSDCQERSDRAHPKPILN